MASEFLKPRFFIIGERKCGTSSLYRYLLDHPQILPCRVKEPQFFSRSWLHRKLHLHRYLSLFPRRQGTDPVHLTWYRWSENGKIQSEEVVYERASDGNSVTGEASANTFAMVPPERLKRAFPVAMCMVLFRDPVARARSHYRMLERFASEGRRLPFRLTDFDSDCRLEITRYERGDRTFFIGPGVYHERLEQWRRVFDTRLKVIITEDLELPESARRILNTLTNDLGLPGHDFRDILGKRYNTSARVSHAGNADSLLREFYSPHNRKLSEMLQRELPWSS